MFYKDYLHLTLSAEVTAPRNVAIAQIGDTGWEKHGDSVCQVL